MVIVQSPAKSRSREQAIQVTAVLPPRVADVMLDCRGTAIATPSFADEVLKAILIERAATSLTVRNAPERFAALLTRAAARLGVAERLTIATTSSGNQGGVIMAAKKPSNTNPPVHTVRHDDGWANKRAGSDKVSKVFPTKVDAQKAGRVTAQREKTEHIIHTADGKIAARNSYGNDPRSS